MRGTIAECYSSRNSILRVPSDSCLLLNAGGMENKAIRRANLTALIAEFGSAQALADKIDTDATYVRNLRNAVDKRGIGDRLARRIEEKLGKPAGWMDTLHDGAMEPEALELVEDYSKASPEWRLTLRLLAKLPSEKQPTLATLVNKVLAGDGGSGQLFDSRARNKVQSQDAEQKRGHKAK
jgi:hypothetical protein